MQQELQRARARFDVINMISGVKAIFGKKIGNQINEQTRQLISFDNSINNVCASNTPPDEAWFNYAKNINELIENSIGEETEKLNEL